MNVAQHSFPSRACFWGNPVLFHMGMKYSIKSYPLWPFVIIYVCLVLLKIYAPNYFSFQIVISDIAKFPFSVTLPFESVGTSLLWMRNYPHQYSHGKKWYVRELINKLFLLCWAPRTGRLLSLTLEYTFSALHCWIWRWLWAAVSGPYVEVCSPSICLVRFFSTNW